MTERLPYPPPFQDLAMLAEHTGLSAATIERRIKRGAFPRPCSKSGKRLWEWKAVEKFLAKGGESSTPSPDEEARRIREATRHAISSRPY